MRPSDLFCESIKQIDYINPDGGSVFLPPIMMRPPFAELGPRTADLIVAGMDSVRKDEDRAKIPPE